MHTLIAWDGKARQACPSCEKAGNDTALHVWRDSDAAGAVAYCHRCSRTWFEHERERRPSARSLDAEAAAAATRERAQRSEAERHAEAARTARAVWNEAMPAPDDHPYLFRKRCASHGVRVDRDGRLVVPMYVDGELCNAQRITTDGKKRFSPGARTAGATFTLTDRCLDDGAVFVAEGFATGATVHCAMALPVIVGFSAGNLVAAARAARRLYPDAPIVIAADNDPAGLAAADAAAIAVCGVLVHPTTAGHDWNDVMVASGWPGVMQALHRAERKARETSHEND